MRSTILILILLFSLLLIPAVLAEDSGEWYTKAQDALTVGDYSTAVTYFNNALQLDKNYAQAYAGRAVAFNMQGKYTDAIASADSALAIKSMDPVALNARAFGLFKLGRYAEAVDAYDNLFLVEQNRKEAYCNQGYAYLFLNVSDAAVVAYDRCTSLDPLNFENWNNKGLAQMQAKKYEAALQSFDHATYITTKNATVWNSKGLALVALGKPSDALECYKKALGIDPNYAEAQANEAEAMGKQQSFNISGTITPKVTISRIGTFYTTAVTPTKQVTEVITQAPEVGDTMPVITTKPVAKKTTYSPLSPVTVLGALVVVTGIFAVMRRN
jgi:tetratricopeptide (TPR) repeat protein